MKKDFPQIFPKIRGLVFPLAKASSAKRESVVRLLYPKIISLMGKSKPTSDPLIGGGTTTPEPTCNPLIKSQRRSAFSQPD